MWCLPESLLPASGAAALLEAWSDAWRTQPPWLLLAPETRAAAWADALRAALLTLPAVAFSAEELRRQVRAAAGLGAALICGGTSAAEGIGMGQPALFTLAPPQAALLRAWERPAPLLGLAARATHEPLDASGLIFEEFYA